jgi:hypothetical protein
MWLSIIHSRWFFFVGLLLIAALVVLLVISFDPVRNSGSDIDHSPTVTDGKERTITPMSLPSNQDMIVDTHTPTVGLSTASICAEVWDIQITSPLPEWLTTPADVGDLHTELKYSILAGQLISNGIVQAGDCPDGGLTREGAANTCGMEKAYPRVIDWQNQFDGDILRAAQNNQIPAQIMKRLFAQETQFWPPNTLAPATYGIGNVTSPGIEPLFMWYEDIYQEACQSLFSTACPQPYHSLPLADQQILRGYLISQHLHVYCPTCPYKIDLEKTGRSIDYFAKLIIANCHQVDLVLSNHGFSTGSLSYEDAWRLTLANYTVGTGCVINAIEGMELSKGFSWEYFTELLSPECRPDIYISRITGE